MHDWVVWLESRFDCLFDGGVKMLPGIFKIVGMSAKKLDRAVRNNIEGNFFVFSNHMDDGLAYLMADRHFVKRIRIMKAQVSNDQGNVVQPVDDL